jgi:hypothetical protein
MKNKEKYNYKPVTMLLDLDEEEDCKILEWLKKNKSKRNSYSVQLRNAVKRAMEDR